MQFYIDFQKTIKLREMYWEGEYMEKQAPITVDDSRK